MISISIVSHGQWRLVKNLLADLARVCINTDIEILLTFNIPEEIDTDFGKLHFPVILIHNLIPKGFGANHNQAFKSAKGEYFCVLNPDIRLIKDPFDEIMTALKNSQKMGVIGPLVVNEKNHIEDSARKFITLWRLLLRIVKKFFLKSSRDYVYDDDSNQLMPDWIAGMFMMFPRKIYEKIDGFDERYYLYCEDMDICMRLKKINMDVILLCAVKVIHASQRDSHRKWRYFYWHLQSLIRFLMKY